jgi:hypothetical protein
MDLKHHSSVRERIAWYSGRATNMGTREIVHRLVEVATKQYSRRLAQGWDAIQAIGPLALLPGDADRMRDCQPDLAVSIAREAEDIRGGPLHRTSGTSTPMMARGFRSVTPIALTYRSATG